MKQDGCILTKDKKEEIYQKILKFNKHNKNNITETFYLYFYPRNMIFILNPLNPISVK